MALTAIKCCVLISSGICLKYDSGMLDWNHGIVRTFVSIWVCEIVSNKWSGLGAAVEKGFPSIESSLVFLKPPPIEEEAALLSFNMHRSGVLKRHSLATREKNLLFLDKLYMLSTSTQLEGKKKKESSARHGNSNDWADYERSSPPQMGLTESAYFHSSSS